MKDRKKNFLYNPLIGNFMDWFIACAIMMPYFNDKSKSPIFILIGVFFGSFATVWLHAYQEAYRIEIKKQRINHDQRFFVRGAIILVASILIQLLVIGPSKEMVLPTIACSFYMASIFWLAFDIMLNTHRELPWNYISEDPEGANSDKFFLKRKAIWVISKIVIFIVGLVLYYQSIV